MPSRNGSAQKKKIKRNRNTSRLLVFGFCAIILIGTVLLSLPIASADRTPTPVEDALFTATSATCITGLVVADTFQHWSLFGQIVILTLIQIGGLGFMTLATLFSLILRRNISYSERSAIIQSLNLYDHNGVIRITKHIIFGTFAFEGAGAVILSAHFIPRFGLGGGLLRGIFTSISAFCNAGFDLMGTDEPFSSLTAYTGDIAVNITVMGLIVIGGLGFLVWEEMITVKKFSRFSIFSKSVIFTSSFLILTGAILIFLLEYDNPGTLANLTWKEKILASLFQSVSPRTAGMNTIDLAAMTDSAKVLTIILMFIGASSGSTGGGVKVNTVAVLIAAILSVIRGNRDVVMFKRKLSYDLVLKALTLVFVGLVLVFVAGFMISEIENVPFLDAVYETVSAFGTVGLTLGLTPHLSLISKFILILLMFMGRVGFLTITFAMFNNMQQLNQKVQYPEGKTLIG